MKLDPHKIAEAIGIPLAKWPGNCYGIACAIVDAGLVEGTAVYGHWRGSVAESGFFGPRAHHPFVQHGWIAAPDGRVIDPTRWVFEDVSPYIYVGRADEAEYDEGGNAWRRALLRPPPEPEGARAYALRLSAGALAHVQRLLGDTERAFTREQVAWLANLPYDALGPFVVEVYAAYEDHEHLPAFIPWDNRQRAKREKKESH